MNAAAEYVCNSFTEIFLAYGQSDEYSFVFNKNTTLFSRRTDKILSCLVSAFTSAYVFNWSKFFEI
jgi:tRNA(His) guanylyltransferase